MPILDLDEDPFAVVVPRVAYVERESRIPERWTWPATDVTNGKLASDHLDYIVQRVVGEMAYRLSQYESASNSAKTVLILKTSPSQNWRCGRWIVCSGREYQHTVTPSCPIRALHTRLESGGSREPAAGSQFLQLVALEYLSNDRFARVIRITQV